jgi:hypothetical protein
MPRVVLVARPNLRRVFKMVHLDIELVKQMHVNFFLNYQSFIFGLYP